MARKSKATKMPAWVEWMGKVTTGQEADPQTGVVYPIGLEIVDPEPMAIPAGMRAPPSLQEQMAELFRVGRLREAQNQDETIDEANDFDIDDYFEGLDTSTPWETEYDPLLGREISPAEFHEKYKSGELLAELQNRFAKLDREEDVQEIISRLDAAYQQSRPGKGPKAEPKQPDQVNQVDASSSSSSSK